MDVPEQSKTKSRKDKIMEDALQIFARKNFQETTIAEISKQAVFPKPPSMSILVLRKIFFLLFPKKSLKKQLLKSSMSFRILRARNPRSELFFVVIYIFMKPIRIIRPLSFYSSHPIKDSARQKPIRPSARQLIFSWIASGRASPTALLRKTQILT